MLGAGSWVARHCPGSLQVPSLRQCRVLQSQRGYRPVQETAPRLCRRWVARGPVRPGELTAGGAQSKNVLGTFLVPAPGSG